MSVGIDGFAGAAAAVETVFGSEEGGEPDAAPMEVVGGVFTVGGAAGGVVIWPLLTLPAKPPTYRAWFTDETSATA